MKKFRSVSFFLLVAQTLQAQEYPADSAFTGSSLKYATYVYHTQRGEESAIFNGIIHEEYSASIGGHAYFQSPDWQKGSVMYGNILYEDLEMKYDLFKDQLIVTPHNPGAIAITLFNPRVEQFSFSTFKFIRIDKIGKNASLSPGFYQQLILGKLSVVLKRTKTISEKIIGTTFTQKFEETAKYYLLKEGIYYPVKTMKDILAVVKDQKKEVRQFLADKKLKYRKNSGGTIIAISEFYNQSGK